VPSARRDHEHGAPPSVAAVGVGAGLIEQRESRLDIAVVRRVDQRLLTRDVGPAHVHFALAARRRCLRRQRHPRLPHGRAAPGSLLGRRRPQRRLDLAVDAGQVVRLLRVLRRRLVAALPSANDFSACFREGTQLGWLPSAYLSSSLLWHGLLLPGRPGALVSAVFVLVVSFQMLGLRVSNVLGLALRRLTLSDGRGAAAWRSRSAVARGSVQCGAQW